MTAQFVKRPTYAEQFAAFALQARYGDFSDVHRARLKNCVLDQIGNQLMGSTLPWTRVVYDYALQIAKDGACVVTGTPSRFAATEAAFVNATFGHSCELDDIGHAGAAVVPAALAVAEQVDASGEELLAAIGVGYEVFFRIFDAIMPQVIERGFHQQVVIGVFAATAAAGRLLKLDADQLSHAFGIAGSHASGTAEYDQSGGEVKRMHAGLGCRGGIQAAMLARLGQTGPWPILEGERGIFRTFMEYVREEGLVDGLGKKFISADKIAFKMYPTVATIQTSIEAFGRIMDEHEIRADDIAEITVEVREYTIKHGASIVTPTTILGAQFSLAFSLGLRSVKGRNELADYFDEKLWTDPRIMAVAKKVHAKADPNAVGDKTSGSRVTVVTKDGRSTSLYVPYRKGTVQNPASTEEFLAKFNSLAGSVLDEAERAEVIRTVDKLDGLSSLRQLTDLIGGSPRFAKAASPRAAK